MEWFFLLVGAAIFFGPIIWALTVGRRGGTPEDDDAQGATALGSLIRRIVSGGR